MQEMIDLFEDELASGKKKGFITSSLRGREDLMRSHYRKGLCNICRILNNIL